MMVTIEMMMRMMMIELQKLFLDIGRMCCCRYRFDSALALLEYPTD